MTSQNRIFHCKSIEDISRLSRIKRVIGEGGVALGAVILLGDPVVAEIAGLSGLDFVWIDAEHGLFNPETIRNMVMAAASADCAAMVRVRGNDANLFKPVLDINPAGVIIPMVKSPEEAEAAVAACRYPTAGIRGCGIRRGRGYGIIPLREYFRQSSDAPWVIPQIEHVDAVAKLDRILAVPGISSICVGPCDLAASMGCINDMEAPEVNRVIDEICLKVKKAGLPLGTASGNLPRWKERGIDWFASPTDYSLLSSGFTAFRKSAEEC